MIETDTAPARLLPFPVTGPDPRTEMDSGALVVASRNTYPLVGQTRGRSDKTGLMAGLGVAMLLGGATFWSMSGHRAAPPPPVARPATPAPFVAPAQGVVFGPAPAAAPARVPGFILPSTPPAGMPLTMAPPRAAPGAAPTLVFDSGGAATYAGPASLAVPGAGAAAGVRTVAAAAGGGENEQFASRVGGDAGEVASARHLSDPATTVVQGTLIPAVLETAIDTDLPGFVRAVVSRDILSFDGSRVLVPRSSRLIGQYKSGLAAGQTRAYVIWTRLIRPDGASVALASPGVDFAGRSGVEGKVDSHFMKRFGSAVLLSIVGGLASPSSLVLSGGQSAASVAAQRDAQIPPTIRVRPGEPIRVFTARDLNFSAVGVDGSGGAGR